MADPREILNSVYRDFFGDTTVKEINEGAEKIEKDLALENLMDEMEKQIKEMEKKGTKKPESQDSKKENESAENKNAVEGEKKEEKKEAKPEKDPMEELNELIGLTDLKKDVTELINLMKLQKMREERGMKSVSISKHLVFSGNPGTGKTTVARILAKLYKQAGILSKGQLVEVDRSGLVAGYIGQTAIKTQEKIQEALGGILFIDEAYALVKDGQDYGQEAIDTILKAMEDNREDFVVIVAGYPDLMKTFVESNPGLKSRFNKYFFFEDYNEDELMKIFDMYLKKNDYTLSPEARPIVEKHIKDTVANKDSNFANARDIRNYFEHIINRQASRAVNLVDASNEDLGLITPDDLKFEKDVFRWAVIGSGKLAGIVGDQLLKSEKHDLVSVYSHNPESCKAYGERYQCQSYDNPKDAIEADGVDGVYIVTPHTSHYEYAKMALEAGKPVLLEKPFTVKASETKELIDLAKEKNIYLAEAMWTWFAPAANYVKFWYDCGLFGDIKKVHIDYRVDGRGYAPRVMDPAKAGGALLDIGIYPLTYLYRLFGKPEKIICKGVIDNGVDESEEIKLTYKNGLKATIWVSIVEENGNEELIIEGSKASVNLPNFHYADSVTLERVGEEKLEGAGDGSYLNEFNIVAKEIQAGLKESNMVPLEATLEVMEIIDECRSQMNLVYPFEK